LFPIEVFQDKSTYRHRRARVTIDFFDLALDEDLIRGRARVICEVYTAFVAQSLLPEGSNLDYLTSEASEHTNCARCFAALFERDREQARELFIASSDYLKSMSS